MKAKIRKEMIARRNALTTDAVMENSFAIQKRLMVLPVYRESKALGLYASFNNEVSTALIFEEASKEGKKVLFPCIRAGNKDLLFSHVCRPEELELGPFGIMAPPYGEGSVDCMGEADLLLIPGVAYDQKGGRIGYGGGFYDRTLHKLTRLPFIAALAYDFQVLDEVPVLPHDIRVNAVVTETRVIVC